MVHTYDPDKVSVVINGTIITGFDSSGVFTYSRTGDIVTPNVGVQGDVAYTENRDETGTLTITLMNSSPHLSMLRSMATGRQMLSVVVKDSNEFDPLSISAENCRITKMPDIGRSKDLGSAQITIFIPKDNL